jgi:hypothetical protein
MVRFAITQAQTHGCSPAYAAAYVAEADAVGLRIHPSNSIFDGCSAGGLPQPNPAALALGSVLIDEPGPGWSRLPDNSLSHGPLDALRAVISVRPNLQAQYLVQLDVAGFVAGYGQAWMNGDERMDLFVYRVRDAAAAAAFVALGQGTTPAPGVTDFQVPGIPGGHGGISAIASDGEYLGVAVFSRGPLIFDLQLRSPTPISGPGVLVATATTQFASATG